MMPAVAAGDAVNSRRREWKRVNLVGGLDEKEEIPLEGHVTTALDRAKSSTIELCDAQLAMELGIERSRRRDEPPASQR